MKQMTHGIKPGLFVSRDIVFAQIHNTEPSGALFSIETFARDLVQGISFVFLQGYGGIWIVFVCVQFCYSSDIVFPTCKYITQGHQGCCLL